MGEVVGLNRARKAKRRADDAAQAAANRAAFGLTKGEKASDAAERRRTEHSLDGAKRGD